MPIEWMPVPEDNSLTSPLPPVTEASGGVCGFFLQWRSCAGTLVTELATIYATVTTRVKDQAAQCWKTGKLFKAYGPETSTLKIRRRWDWNASGGVRFSGGEATQGMRETLQESEGQEGSSVHSSATVTKSWTPAHLRQLNTEERVTEGFLIWFFYLEMSPTWCGNSWNVAKETSEPRGSSDISGFPPTNGPTRPQCQYPSLCDCHSL